MTAAPYRLTGWLETGELAELFLALRDEREKVVVKLFHPQTSDERYARALAEAQRRLGGAPAEGIIHSLEMGMVGQRLAVVREHVEGLTLGKALQRLCAREAVWAPQASLHLVILLLEAADLAHRAQVIHGAITPGNVILGTKGRVALTDFGALAALGAVPELEPFLQQGRGTYRAPETARGSPASEAGDLYSLGAIAYELLTLKAPAHQGRTVSGRGSGLVPPSRLDRRLNARIDPLILRALEAQPQRRYRSCAELSEALRDFLSTCGGMPSRPELARLLAELGAKEPAPQASGPLPLLGPFALGEVKGARLARPKQAVLIRRPSFSSPAHPAGQGSFDDDHQLPDTYIPGARPPPDESTDPGAEAPLESGWEAPPGPAPAPRRAGKSGPPAKSLLALRARVRRGEDPQEDAAAGAPPEEPELLQAPFPLEAPEVPEPPADEEPPEPTPVFEPSPAPRPARKEWWWPLAFGVALACSLFLGWAVWRGPPAPSQPPPPTPLQVPSAIAQEQQPAAAPEPALEPGPALEPAPAPEAEAEAEAAPPPQPAPALAPAKAQVAFLTLTSDQRARVYVDGKLLPGTTPMRRRRLEPGTRKVAVVSVRTGERREFTKRFEAGKTVSVKESFGHRRR